MSDLAGLVEESIQRHRLLRDGERVLVGVSGGLDSMVLLEVLRLLARPHRWRLVVAHFNHCLRGRDSEADEALVRRTARRLRLPCAVERGEVKALADKEGLSVEMAARQMRHEFLARLARRKGIRKVALAHHADDRVELFFLRLLRGAGLDGLAGMKRSGPSPADHRLKLVRPLFDFSKAQLRAHAARSPVRFREDASNAWPEILRNRVRHELLPRLRRGYQPALDRVILRLLNLLGDTAELLDSAVSEWNSGGGTPFGRLPAAVQREVVLSQLHKLGAKADYERVEELRLHPDRPVMIKTGRRLRRDRLGHITLEILPGSAGAAATRQEARRPRQRDSVMECGGPPPLSPAHHRFRSSGGPPPSKTEVDLSERPGQAEWAGVSLAWRRMRRGRLPPRQAGREYFDADKVGPRVVLRHWQEGDRFQPLGLPHLIKLQDWFTNRKVPRTRRHKLVVATTQTGQVFWVEDQRIAEGFKVTGQTRRRLRWDWRRT